MTKHSTHSLALGLLLIACRETRGEPDPFHGDERDAADVPDAEAPKDAASDAPADAASDAGAQDAAPLPSDGAPPSDGPPLSDGATTPSDAQTGPYKWYDSMFPPPEGAWPVDAEVRSQSVDAGFDRGCILPTASNPEGVGASCFHDTRDQTCFPLPARTCIEALTLRGLDVPAPYYCTRPCRQHSDCGKGASCCTVPGLEGNACILHGCRHSCR